MKKKETIQVELKPRWNFIAKFYFFCILVVVLFTAYIVIYRYVNKDKIIENARNSNIISSQEITQNMIQ